MTDNDDRRWLYERMQQAGVNTGNYDEFTASLNNKEDRDWYYQKSLDLGLDVGSADDFAGMMADSQPSSSPVRQPAGASGNESPYQMASQQTPVYNYGGEYQTPGSRKRKPTPTANASAIRAGAAPVRPARSTMEQQVDEVRSRIYEQDPTAIANVTDAERARWEELSRRRAEEEAQQQVNERERTREELANLEQSIEQQLNEAGRKAEEELTNNSDAKTLTSKNSSFGDKLTSAFRLSMRMGPSESNSVAPQSSMVYAAYNSAEFQDLRAAQRKLRNAKRIIAEADHNAQQGTFGDWLERSFMGGAARGFAQRATDFDTWDFGLTDLIDNEGLKMALDAADRGEHLTKSQQALLDATVIEMAVNTYFGSEVGRGYKAGSVTAESLPFMLEMMINPAAGIGESMSAKMTRYALKRFGMAAVKKGGKKYAARKGMEITGRVMGDALVGAPTMAATTGAVRTTADAFERMNNAQMAGEEMSFGEAFGKAFANTTIENYSEMLGAYFKPLAGATGDGLTRIATSKAGSKIGLNRVHDFIENVGASDVARLVTDFEKHARWNGVFGEYAEEVVGGVMNAIIVGDQTLDADPETGVFNLDQNIDTFLGVSLLGGFMSGVKTAGYRTPKYQTRKAMNEADNVCRSAFENEDVNWDAIRTTLSTGNVADVKAVLQDIVTNPEYTDEQKRAVLDYASKATAYKGMLTAEQKRRASGEESDEQMAAEEAYDRGYEAVGDEVSARDIAMEFSDESIGTSTTEERQAAWDGLQQRIADDADMMAEQLREEGSRMMHADGYMRPATLKEKDEAGNDRQVYIIDGNVQMMADGTMIDPEASDKSVVIYDPSTGEKRMIDPMSGMGILSLAEPTSAEDFENEVQRRRDEYIQAQLDNVQGTVNVQPGDQFTMPDGSVATVQDNDGETITFVQADGTPTSMPVAEVQRIADELAMVDYQQRHQEQEQMPEDVTNGVVEGAPTEFTPDMEIIVNDNGEEKPAIVMGRVKLEGKQYVPDENGAIVEYMMDGDVKHDHIDKLAGKTVSYVEATPAVVPTEEVEAMPQPTEGTPQAEPMGTVEAVGGEGAPEVHDEQMPMRVDGEANFLATTPERGHQYIYNEAGLSREEAGEFVKANIDAATKELEGLKKKAPKMGTSLVKYKQQQAEHQAKVDAAQQAVDYWQGVKATQSAIVSAEMAEQAERDRAAHEAAVQEEAARQAEELAKREEQAALGSNAVAPQIVEKWTASPKVEGVENEITLANGEKVKGHYMLVESGAATPSHNPNMEFSRNEGFPIDENGQTVNDRDYERDQEAQRITRQMADSYDSRAIQNVPVVSQEGIVLSGNGRTMAGELAAQQGTDVAYIEHLKKYPQQFGFTPEQVEGMQHPRVVFVADEDMPYTTDTFAKFNQQDMKSQSRTEQSVKMGKTVDDSTFGRIIRSINGFDSLADFYNDPVAATNAIGELHSAGAINNMQLAEMMDGEKVSGNGRQMLENMLIGKAFESNPDAIRQLAEFPAMRQSVVSALAEIANNIHLGEEYSLESELAQAINLAYQARKNGTKAGDKVSWFARQQSLFPFDTGETVADYTNATVLMLADELNSASVNGLKKCLALYNRNASEAAAGQYDIFSGGIKSKQDIINDALNVLNYGTEQEQQAALAAAVEQRKQGIQQDGVAGPGEAGDAGAAGGNDGRGGLGSADQWQGGVSSTEEIDENGIPFVKAEDGTTNFGEIREESGLPAAPIRLSQGRQYDNGKGYGLVHIEANHGEQIRNAGFASVEDFVSYVAKNYDEDNIRVGKHRINGNTTYLIQVTDEHDNTLFIELSRDGSYWNVNSGGIFRKGYSNKRETVAKTEPQQPNNAVSSGSSLSTGEEGGITPAEPNGEPTVSGSKDTNISETDKEKVASAIESAESEVNTNPTEGQKEAGNYKKGHLKLDGYDITIEQPKGSIRRGTDDNGKAWEQEMHNTYGYIRGTEGVDGDHIDVFLSDDPTSGDVFVVDQVDQMGIFDEHKVMYGFPDMESAKAAYLSNYEEGWQGLGAITPVSKEEFKKWIESSHRKTKPFAEYASVKALGDTELPSMTAEQQAIGDAMVYQLESMGFEVSTDISENRRVHKEAEKDNSEAGKLRHYKTTDGKVYGFSYKGKMYLDPRRINADLPLHEYAHLWCEALGKLNPEGWKGVVDLMKGDAETWNLVKQLVPDLTDENDIAAEMIARYSSRNGAERAKAEYERMNAGGNFGNIWQNIAKAIQDFWRQVGDFLNIKYKSVEQVYDQVVKDFANRINPRRRVEEWLAERDEAYMQAVESGDAAKAKELFDAALRENVGNGITPFIAVDGYRGKMDRLAREVKSRDPKVIAEVAKLLSPLVPTDAVLVPAPSHSGEATDMLDVANAIAERTGAPVADVLKGDARESQHEAKKENGQPIAASQLGITMNGELPEGKLPVVIDNVVDSGNTAEACVQALGKGVVVSLSEAVDRYDHVVSLKSAAPVVHDKSGAVVPLSKRFELGGSRYLDKAHANDEAPLSLKEMAEASDDVALEMQHAEQRGAEDNDGKNANEMHEEDQPKEETKKSKWVDEEDAERFEALRRRMRELKGHLNMGVNPEQLAIGVEMSYYVIKHGARKFGEYAKQMIDALGEWARPYLKSFYNGARDLPDMAGLEKELTPYDEVRAFDVMNFDKEGPKDIIAMAEHIVKERDAEKQAVEATAKLKKQRNAKRKKMPVTEGPNLFSGIEDAEPKGTATEQPKEEKPINNNSHETTDVQPRTSEEGREGHELKQNGAMGEGAGNEAARPDGGGVAGRDTAHPGTDGVGSEGVSGEVESEQGVEQPKRNLNNNHAERGTDYAPKDVDKRIAANIAAIEKMQELMESGQQATPKDMAVLRKFSGWGGLGKAFQETGYGYGYDPTATSKRLKALLGDEAYEQANMSRNSAYYTPAKVIDALWDIANTMGFKGGKVLEGSAGIGNILGLMPQEMSEKSDIHAVEIDSTTGNILKLLYPDAKVDVQGFEATEVENGSVDLAITNVPFVTGLRVNDTTGDKDLSKKFHDIHDFCIAKNVRKLREGGIGIFITSSGTMDNSTKLREWIVQEGGADVVGAFRMNNETFGGTGATSDIIVIRKRVNGKKSAHAIDVLTTFGARTVEYDTGDTKKVKGEYIPIVKQMSLDYNKYFIEHPEMMGGEMGFAFEHGDTYRATSKGLYPKKGINQDERLAAFVKSMEGFDDEANQPTESAGAVDNVYAELGDGVKEGSMIVRDGKLCVAQRGRAVPLMSAPKKGEKVSEEELVARFHKNKVRGHTKAECLQSYQAIKDALSAVLEYQTENESDEGLQPLLDALNNAYDQFVDTYGHLHRNNPIAFLKNDVDFANILALERFSERGDKKGNKLQEFGKTDIFSQRVVEKEKAPEPTNTKDGIIASIYVHGRVDVPWIAATLSQHAGHEVTEAQVKDEIIKAGLGFENPASRQVEVSYEYLSGNVREKLAQAQQNNTDGRYDANIKALEDVIPMNIPSHLIDFSIGSSWINPKLYEDYVKERTDIDVTFTPVSGTWYMKKPGFLNEEKNRSFGIVSQMFGKTIMGTELIEAAMTNKTITVSETRRTWDGKTVTETDKDATTACANKIDEIRQDFKEWARGRMQSDPAMSEHIEKVYNEMFNNYVPKSIPDEFVPEHFGGAATMVDGRPFSLRPHQGKAAVRATTQPLLLAHEVGTGKTYTLITTAMEMRRLGTARKPMIVVQNSTVGQFVESAKKLYPNAKVLTLEDKDHTAEGRKNFYAKIKYNDWDMIVVPQSVFERIPDSEERQSAFVKDKIEEKEKALEQMRDADPDGNSMIVKQAEREIEKLEEELAALTTQHEERRKERDAKREAVVRQNAEIKALEMLDRQTDDVENFDDMGIDALLVDEAHEYKHLGFATAMQRGVKGIDPSFSKKAQGVFLKTQAVLEKNNGRNVVFATGTPISNTAAEIWTFMRYLMPADTMREYDIYYFDDFVRNFGNLTQMLEFTTSGKFKENNRFAGYVNLPELVRIWSGVADTVLTAEAGGVSDKIPDMEGGKAKDIYLPQTKALRSVMKYVKSELERFENMTGKQKKENSYIPLTMYGIAKAAAVDARLVVVDATDDEHSKTNEAVRQTLKSLEETKSYKGAVAIFADNYQNKRSGFNLYEDIREKLVAAGVPEEQIIVMKSGMSVKKKLEIFDMVNRGDVRVIMGSTFTLGTGVNIQERLHTLIHVDAPNRPMDYTQRNGRILRQGNLHKDMGLPVRVLRFGVEDSLDVTAYQRLKTKGAIADSIMNGKQMMSNSMENRVLEEEEDVFGDTIAQLSGSEYAMLKNQAEKDVRKYENKKKQWEADQTYCHNEIPRLESKIRQAQIRLDEVKKALDKVVAMASQHTEPTIIVDNKQFASIDAMADFIKEFNKKIRETESEMRENPYDKPERSLTMKVNVGGFDFIFTTAMSSETTSKQGTLFSAVHRKMSYSCEALGLEDIPVRQSLLREGMEDIVQNVITGNDFRERIENLERGIEKNKGALAQVRERDGKPFGYIKELEAAHKHLDEYTELMKKEMEEKEKKYAEMDADVEEAVDVVEAEEAGEEDGEDEDVRMRDGVGDQTIEVSYEESLANSRAAGYSKKQHDAMIARRWEQRIATAQEYAKRLGLDGRVNVVLSADEIENISERKKKAKGWYDTKTDKIVVVLYNHSSMDDVAKTLLHEGVAHYGLRELFGKRFDQFLTNVYEHSDEGIRREIAELAKDHGWDFRTATEEYLARMAEDMDFEKPERQSWWANVKTWFFDMLHKIGLQVKDWYDTLTDNELRYILWRSYKNLTEPGYFRSLAEDTVMQSKLKVGQFEEETTPRSETTGTGEGIPMAAEPIDQVVAKMRKERPGTLFLIEVGDHYEARGEDARLMSEALGIKPTKSGIVRIGKKDIETYLMRMIGAGHRVALAGKMDTRAAENDLLFRDGDFSERDRAIARDHYERMVASGGYQFKEAMQDSMLGLRKAYEAILKGSGKNAAGVHRKGFRIEEVPGNENAYLAENRMSSVNAAEQHNYFREWMQPLLKAVHDIAGSDKALRKQLVDYMMAKHGLERNEKFAARDAQAAAQNGADYNKEYQNNRKKDYSGLTALTGNAYTAAAEAAAQQMVADFEADYDTTELWEKVNDATKTTLAKIYQSGMLSEESYEQIRDMFDYYIPLRGWDETTSDEVYGYLTSKDGPLRGSTIKHAYGRSSKADDPIATIGLMADTAIRQANRNEMKQRFLTFAQNHPSDLVSVSKLWLQYDAANDEWVPVFADIKADDSAYDVERKVKAFEERMEQLATSDPDNYKSGEDAKNIPYKVVKGNVSEHQVLVKRDGVTYVLTINGNPRAAQALNGLTNPDVETAGVIGNMLKVAEYTNRQLSAFYTTRTPDFIVSNFFRDMLYSNCMTWVKENPRYALTFHKNFGKVNPATMRVLFGKWEKGTLDDGKALEHQFKMFMLNGGETGYTNVKDIEGKKREIVAELKRQGSVPRKAWNALGMQLDLLNRSVENCARFAAFITSQELGRSIERSIYDAKEVSVNFNKKGSGGKMVNANGQTGIGKVGSYMSGGGRLFYVFWNAGVQGMTNFGRAAKRHPGKFAAGAASMFTLGAVIPLLAQALGGDDDDDKNAYYNLPEYVRRSNICFRTGEQWITIPLPIEFRAIYGMGELVTGVISGNENYSDGELAKQMVSQMSQVMPLDFMEGGGGLHAFIPSVAKPLVEAASNKGWTGLPIYKDTPWNQNDPEFTKVYKSADKYIVGASKWLNEFTGGDDYKKGWADVVNPAQVEYILNGYFGGYFKVPNQLVKMAETAFGDREFEWRNMMIANRLVKSGDERTAHRKLVNEYFEYKREYEETKRLKKKYEKAAEEGVVGYAEKVNFLNNSEEYARYLIFDQYRKQIDDLYKLQRDEPDEEKRKSFETEYYQVMREMVDAMHDYERGRNR